MRNRLAGAGVRLGAPAALLVVTSLHPAYSADAAGELARIAGTPGWLVLHLALLAAIVGYDAALLGWPSSGPVGRGLRLAGVVVNLVCYSAFVGVDGVAAGLLARSGDGAGVATLFGSPLVSGLALLGAAGWLVAALTVAVALAADLRALPAGGLLVGSALLLGFSHAPPTGPLGAALALAAAGWAQLVGARAGAPAAGGR